jgi:hypothetical protein
MWEKTFGMTRRPPMCLNAGLSFFERFDEQKSREAISFIIGNSRTPG